MIPNGIVNFFSVHRSLFVGYSPADRTNVDTVTLKTYIYKQPLPMSGIIDKVHFYAVSNRPLTIGLYKYIALHQYQVKKLVTLQDVKIGLNQVIIMM